MRFSCLSSRIAPFFIAKISFLLAVTRVLLGLSQCLSDSRLECECLDWLIEYHKKKKDWLIESCEACSSPVLTLVGQRIYILLDWLWLFVFFSLLHIPLYRLSDHAAFVDPGTCKGVDLALALLVVAMMNCCSLEPSH